MERIDHKGTEKIWAPDGIWIHDPPCSRSDALTSDLPRTRWWARVIFSGLDLRTASRSHALHSLHLPLFTL